MNRKVILFSSRSEVQNRIDFLLYLSYWAHLVLMQLFKWKASECLYTRFSLSSPFHACILNLNKHFSIAACLRNVNTATLSVCEVVSCVCIIGYWRVRPVPLDFCTTRRWTTAQPNENNFSQHSPQKKFCWHGFTELKRLLDAMAARECPGVCRPEVAVTPEILNWEHKSCQCIRTDGRPRLWRCFTCTYDL